ncbi:hypothetical protein [Streptomyces sp. NPDC048332]|uniref:hypothetical protein n=1 Tax=Streptomyces sp. NPDC048332 TaxID=3154619 RepID=UPI00343B9564
MRPVPCQDLDPSHGIAYVRRYLTGLKCDRHTPSAWAGRPESPPGPGWPAGSYLNQLNPEPPAEEQEPS